MLYQQRRYKRIHVGHNYSTAMVSQFTMATVGNQCYPLVLMPPLVTKNRSQLIGTIGTNGNTHNCTIGRYVNAPRFYWSKLKGPRRGI